MTDRPRHVTAAMLPNELPIFPLPGAVLLPHGRMPLNIFEPRYLNMIEDALGNGRFIGMIQPYDETDERQIADGTAIYEIGCVGRIIEFAQTDDGRYVITLEGVTRFRVAKELSLLDGYRRVMPDYSDFLDDMDDSDDLSIPVLQDREQLMTTMQRYFDHKGISADMDSIDEAPDTILVTSLAMSCPLDPRDKQALLECPDTFERGQLLTSLFEFAIQEGDTRAPEGRQ
jgi:Lon protease-like protein